MREKVPLEGCGEHWLCRFSCTGAAVAVAVVSLAPASVPSVFMVAFHVAFSDILHLPGLQGDSSDPGCGPCVEDCRWLVLKYNWFLSNLEKSQWLLWDRPCRADGAAWPELCSC